jgi:hypothetical protein
MLMQPLGHWVLGEEQAQVLLEQVFPLAHVVSSQVPFALHFWEIPVVLH